MKRFYVMLLCLSLLFSQPLVRVEAADTSTNSSTDTSLSVPTPTPPPPPSGIYDWNDKNMRRESGIFTYQILDETEKKAAIVKVNEAVNELTVPAVLDNYKIVSIGQIPIEGNTVYEPDATVDVSEQIRDSLETLTISEGIRHIGYDAFFQCEKLTTVNLPENLCCVGTGAFKFCSSLKSINFPKSTFQYGIHIMENAFAYCISLDQVVFISPNIQEFQYSDITKLILAKNEERYFNIDLEQAVVGTLFIDPYIQKVYFAKFFPEYNYTTRIGKIIVNGKNTELDHCSSRCTLGALYTVPKAKCIRWAKKYKHTYKIKSCGKMGKVTRKKQKATWKSVKTTVKTYDYNKQKKKWKIKSSNVKTYYKVYGKNSKKGSYKLIKTTTKTSCKTKYKYLKVQPVATWE